MKRHACSSLACASVAYLFFPVGIFFLGYLRIWLSLPVLAFSVWSLVRTAGYYQAVPERAFPRAGRRQWIAVIAMVLAWVFLAGIGGYSYQNSDYLKHSAMLLDLATLPWPVTYLRPDTGTPLRLVFYCAYYLPAAVAWKLFGREAACFAAYLWAAAGVLLALLWFFRFIGRFSFVWALFFVFFSGMDFIGLIINRTPDNAGAMLSATAHIEWWAGIGFWNYPSNTSQLFWAPHQAVAGWILASLVYHCMFIQHDRKCPLVFVGSLAPFWSPFVSIGLAPLCILIACFKGIKKMLSWENLCGMMIVLIMALFFSANLASYNNGPLWMFHELSGIWPRYLSFVMLEFGFYALLAYPYVHNADRRERLAFGVLTGTLALVPFYVMGLYNDFAMRVSIPALYLLQVYIAGFFMHYRGWFFKSVMAALLVIGALAPVRELARALVLRNPVSQSAHVVELAHTAVAVQYLGDPESIFFKYLARRGHAGARIPQGVLDELRRH